MKSQTLAKCLLSLFLSAAIGCGIDSGTADAAAMANMNMNGSAASMASSSMNMTMTTRGSATSSVVTIPEINNMNAEAEIEAAPGMHNDTTAASTDTMSMMMGSGVPLSTNLADFISQLDHVGEGFWWTVILFFILISACFLYPLSGMSASLKPPLRSRIARWLRIAAFSLTLVLGIYLIYSIIFLVGSSFQAECEIDGNSWGMMQPSVGGQAIFQTPVEGCMWGMGKYMYMFSNQTQYQYFENLASAKVTLSTTPQQLVAGVPTTLTVSLKNADGTPATLFIDMDKVLHVIIISKDESVFAHIHPDDDHPLTAQEIKTSTFTVRYTFPKSGDYLIAVDYAHGLTLESKQFQVHVAGSPAQSGTVTKYPTTGTFDGYSVSLKYPQPISGEVETIVYNITKDGKPVTFVPWLEAAMHVSVVKNDFSWYLHVHGEVHPPGQPVPPIIVKNGQVLHSMAMMMTPPEFSLPIEAHLIFPAAGTYTVWGQFKTLSGDLVATAFTVQVEQ